MHNNSKIKNLILDFGGVIYQISHTKQMEYFKGLGVKNFEYLYSQAIQNPLFEELEIGSVSNDDFMAELKKMLPGNISADEIGHAWNSILVGFIDDAVSLLKKLKKKYNLFLLSNTNAIHYNIYMPEFNQKYGYDFEELFAKAYWSFKIGLRKPGHEIFNYVLEDVGLIAGNCLFIDDSIQNTVAADECDIKSIWLKPGLGLTDLFDDNLGLIL